MATDRFGIDDSYHDARGARHETSRETRAALQAAMGVAPETAAPPLDEPDAVRVLLPGSDRTFEGGGDLVLEDGSSHPIDGALPETLPFGYHRLYPRGGGETLLVVSPSRCFLPDDLRTWGFAAQLYAARSRDSWGIGDLADLARLGRWTKGLGGGVLMVNPLTAPTPVAPIEPSPYYPSSRRYRNPLFLRIEELPGWDALPRDARARLTNAATALNHDRHIDRDAIFRLKQEALELLFARFGGEQGFDWFCAGEGQALTDFATYCALAERQGKDWRQWPEGFRRPDSADVARFRAAEAGRVRFHAWTQWLIDAQLARASKEIGVVHDLPIGLDVAGADAWCWQDMMARDVSVGAPADEFNANGQDWGLTPFIPGRLRAAHYRPFIETIRAMLRHAGGLRIDHVMGLFRLFWIPRALGATRGAYVRTRADELLAIVALESQRAEAFIIGEDLGTVEAGVRERLAEQRMLSYRLLYFEPSPPQDFPELALSSVTTHDLPTIAGLWTGADLEALKRIGQQPNEEGTKGLRDKLRGLGDLRDDAPVEEAIESTHRALARAPSRVLLATLDDAVAVPERPNVPGTVREWPNWSLALPQTIEEIETMDLPRRLAGVLKR
ncbi:MAG TPA: 4-alpha-glucanotransferase [Polyangia bacterium]|jgi:4-alpha-glucanotransferase|nr:4-alpha-glucanotransferase [Polyangia bacterium]